MYGFIGRSMSEKLNNFSDHLRCQTCPLAKSRVLKFLNRNGNVFALAHLFKIILCLSIYNINSDFNTIKSCRCLAMFLRTPRWKINILAPEM